MLFQVGGRGIRPTFFEMAAAQQLPASLRAALTYSIGMLALRRPFLHKVLDYEHEFFALLMLVLERNTGLHALGIHVCRATGQELMDNSSRISKIRSRERDGLCGPPWLKALQGAILRCAYVMLDYAQTGLIASVFIFKMMEWWYQSAEERMSAPTVYPPPPPPPPPKYKRCPVTLMPATVEQIRRPFHDV